MRYLLRTRVRIRIFFERIVNEAKPSSLSFIESKGSLSNCFRRNCNLVEVHVTSFSDGQIAVYMKFNYLNMLKLISYKSGLQKLSNKLLFSLSAEFLYIP